MKKKLGFGGLFLGIILVSLAFYWLCGQADNKYAAPGYTAKLGTVRIQPQRLTTLYLAEGWAYYDGKRLTPAEIMQETPDEYLYLGQYSGFDRGDPQKSPYGQATYRLTIFTDNVPREYALEIPQIYSNYQLWINGSLMAASGSGNRLVTFESKDKIELVWWVEDKNGLYGGLTYPPAFGTPAAVGQALSGRLAVHTGAAAIALLIFVLCLGLGLGNGFARPYHLLAALCLCFGVCTAYPIFHAFGLSQPFWLVLERLGYYSIFLLAVLIQRKLCGIPKAAAAPVLLLGAVVLASIMVQPLIQLPTAGLKYAYGDLLALYKWLTAAWLLGASAWAVWREKPYSLPLTAGFCVLAAALVADRLRPLYEPKLLGWPLETAGFVLLLLVTGILWHDAARAFREGVRLQSEKAALENAGKMKSEFLHNLSHELQMPLTVVSGYAQLTEDLLQTGNFDTADLADNQRHIVLEADKMERMVLQLLDVAKIERGRLALNITDVSLGDLIQQFADAYFPMLDEHHNRLELRTDEVLPLVSCDTERLVQVLINLVANACRHTQNGVITLAAHRLGNEVEISVTDTGEGIPEELQPYLFTQFLTGARGKAAGTGLGLYICKQTVEAHGGTIAVESAPGAGTTVRLRIPLRIPLAGAEGGMEYGAPLSR